MASCCRCCRAARSCSAASWRRCCGRGSLHATLELINPALNARIDWPWFVVSQIGFGIVAGARRHADREGAHAAVRPFAVRAGVESPGLMTADRDDEDER